jgi:hypothetical protein
MYLNNISNHFRFIYKIVYERKESENDFRFIFKIVYERKESNKK